MSEERPSIVSELGRRKVYRVVVVYAGVAWGLLQMADLAFPRLGLPDWSVTLVLGIAAAGFPVAIALAWFFELTPDGIRLTPSRGSDVAATPSPARVLEFALILGLVAAVGYLYATRLTPGLREAAPLDASKRSIAVLPFVNMSQDSENEYFSEGISEEILDGLAKLEDLHVAARTSSFTFKGQNRDVREIGELLSVATVLEGSVRKAGNRVRITAQLIDSNTGYHLWSDAFNRELTDIFAVQEEISRAIVEALHVPLGLSDGAPIVKTGTSNPEAYNTYLRGLHQYGEIGPASFTRTIETLREAIALDPNYAKPHGVIASSYMIGALWMPIDEAFPEAKRAFDRALELDPNLDVALVAKAQYITFTDWDWMQAKTYFERALADGSDMTVVAQAYSALHLMPLGLTEEAAALLAEAAERDPLDIRIKIIRGTLALAQGRAEEAIREYDLALDIDPNNREASTALCLAHTSAGDFDSAESMLEAWRARLGDDHTWMLPCRVFERLARFDIDGSLAAYEKLAAAAHNEPGSAFLVGDVAVQLGKVDEAVEWYLESIERRELPMVMVRLRNAQETALHEHPRYQSMLKALGIDDASLAEMGITPKFAVATEANPVEARLAP